MVKTIKLTPAEYAHTLACATSANQTWTQWIRRLIARAIARAAAR